MRWSNCAPARGASRTRARRRPSCTTGLIAASQNRWPSLAFDIGAINDAALAGCWSQASTTRPSCGRRRFWEKLYEPLIRRAAGLGRAAGAEDPDHYEKAFAHLRRAGDRRRAGRSGGGACGRPRRRARHPRAMRISGWAAGCLPSCRDRRHARHRMGAQARPNSRPCPMCGSCARTAVYWRYDHGKYGAVERVERPSARCRLRIEPRQRAWRIIAKRAVLAAGAHRASDGVRQQRSPGVMLAGAVRDLSQPLCGDAGRRDRGLHQQ